MKFTAAFVVSSLLAFQASATPLTAQGPQNGSPQKMKAVKDTVPHAHAAVLEMEKVHAAAVNGDKTALGHIHTAFGANPNLHAIGQHIQTLKNGKVRIDEADHPSILGAGSFDGTNVNFGTAFHTSNDKERAGHFLHEASHALIGTKDVFDAHGNPMNHAKPNPGEHSGYRDSDLPHLKAHFSPNMHQNADSWREFGRVAAPHLVARRVLQLERRAYERQVIEREILRRILARSRDMD